MGCSLEKAKAFKKAYDEGFPGITEFKIRGSKAVRKNGYVLMCEKTGAKMYWYDFNKWLDVQKKMNADGFWDDYKSIKRKREEGYKLTSYEKNTIKMVKEHFKAASKWDRMALNAPTQNTGVTIIKEAMTMFFNWIVENNLFGEVRLETVVHDR